MKPVIICGGWGTKMWPISREHHPKHFINLLGGKSLFQMNYDALRTKFEASEIYVSTNVDQMPLARQQAPEIPLENYILEPEMRNQGPATGLIAAVLYHKGYGDEPFMILQVDDLREPVDQFIKMIMDCDALARRETKYITGGFRPEFPVMGVDYLVKGERVSVEGEVSAYKVAKFVWRGSKEQTEEFIKDENALLHANHTCMTPKNFLAMMEKYKPEWYGPLRNIADGGDINSEFVKMPSGPLEDVTEKVHADGESLVVELPFKWDDFGTFESVYKYMINKGIYKNPENTIESNAQNNFIRLDDSNKVVSIIGLSNIVVMDTGDALLICDQKQSGLVGDVLKEVKKREISLT